MSAQDLAEVLLQVLQMTSGENTSFDDPDEPVGDLGKPLNDNWLKRQNIDPHEVKKGVPGKLSEFDIYQDRDGNLWAIRKPKYNMGGNAEPYYLGNLDDFRN